MPEKSLRHLTALALAAAGTPVFPCRVNAKFPVTAGGFKDATTNPDTINGWWGEQDYNLAVSPHDAGWCVVDLDGAEGIAEWATMPAAPETFVVRTPRGGLHVYFKGELPSTVKKLAPHIDTRGRGGYVLMAPSIVDGKSYTVECDADVALLPDWVAPRLGTETKPVDTRTAVVSPAEAEYRAREFLKVIVAAGEVSIEGSGGDARLYEVCCVLVRDLGCSEDLALALLQELFNPFCRPPWDDYALGVKIANASRYGTIGAGAYSGQPTADVFAAVAKDALTRQNPPPAAFPEPTKLGDIPGEEQPVAMVIDHWIQKHKINVFRGRGGSNKSRLALQWAMLVDAGESRAGFVLGQPSACAALYISCEDDQEEVKRRRNAISRKLDLPPSGVLYFDMTDQDNAFLMVAMDGAGVRLTDKWNDLERRLLAIEGHKLVVLDSTYDVIDFEGSTKNSDNHVKRVITLFDRLARRVDATFICLWHPSRAGMGRGDEGGFATAWDNAPRNAISIKPTDDPDIFELRAEKRNNLGMGQPMLLRWDSGAMVPIVASEADAIMEHEAVVEIALMAAAAGSPIQANRKPVTWIFGDIERKIGHKLSAQQVRDHLGDESRREHARVTYRTHDPHGRGEPAGFVATPPAKP